MSSANGPDGFPRVRPPSRLCGTRRCSSSASIVIVFVTYWLTVRLARAARPADHPGEARRIRGHVPARRTRRAGRHRPRRAEHRARAAVRARRRSRRRRRSCSASRKGGIRRRSRPRRCASGDGTLVQVGKSTEARAGSAGAIPRGARPRDAARSSSSRCAAASSSRVRRSQPIRRLTQRCRPDHPHRPDRRARPPVERGRRRRHRRADDAVQRHARQDRRPGRPPCAARWTTSRTICGRR